MKRYSFLQEVLGTALATGLAVSGIAMSTLGLVGTVNNIIQNKFNDNYIFKLRQEIFKSKTQQQALNIVKKYCTELQQSIQNEMVGKKIPTKKIQNFQYFLLQNFSNPLYRILSNSNDPQWKHNALKYIVDSHKKIKSRNFARNTLSTALNVGMIGGGLSGLATKGTISLSANVLNNLNYIGIVGQFASYISWAKNILNEFNGQRYINKMVKELNNVPDNNRKMANQILNKYCFNISKYINDIVVKSKKTIDYDIQANMRSKFSPLFKLINDPNNKYWKTQMLDYINENRLQSGIQQISQSTVRVLLSTMIRR